MSNIIQLHFGQTGNSIGDKFWSVLRDEHCLDVDGVVKSEALASPNDNIGAFYYEEKENKYVPRALFADLGGSREINQMKAKQKHYYREDNYIVGVDGAANIWAKGYYSEGASLADLIMERIRAEVERSESLQGFQLVHSIAAGTGSGLGTLILTKLREEYPDRVLWTYSATGLTPEAVSTVLAPYNRVLAMHQLIQYADAVVYLDDAEAFSIARKYKVPNPTFEPVNILYANIMSDITSSMRFRTEVRSNLRKMAFNLAPFPRIHFLLPARSPITANILENKPDINTTFKDITTELLNPHSLLLHDNKRKFGAGKILAASCFFRGNIPLEELDDHIVNMQSKYSPSFIEWIPDNIKTSICSVPPININMSGAALVNTTSIIDNLKKTTREFHAYYKRSAFMTAYCGEGMDEIEFKEAFENINTLIEDYERYQYVDIKASLADNPEDEVE